MSSDLIDRQAAIDAVVGWFCDLLGVEEISEDLGCLVRLRELPSAQPEQRWIDTIREVIKYSGSDGFIIVPKDGMEGWDASGVHYMIQPEIIRCKDCRFHEHEQPGMVYCPAVVGGWVEDDWFYKGGERRTE